MLHDEHFLTFDGEPIPGRVPARVILLGDSRELTREQANAVRFVYNQSTREQRLSLVQYAIRHYQLRDGTRVRIEHSTAGDRVFVTPPEAGPAAIELQGYVILPKDASNTTGWNLGSNPDSARAYLPAKTAFPDPLKPQLHVKLQAGAVDWRGANDVVLTWSHGGNNRYHTSLWDSVFTGTNADNAASGIYYKGTKINTPAGVSAAAIFEGRLVMISNTAAYFCGSPIGGIDAALQRGEFLPEVSPDWTSITVSGSVSSARRCSAWHFTPDGARAACAVVYDSFGVNTWTMERMRTEALDQAKRYLDFSIVSDAVEAAVSDTAYTGEAFACTVDGDMVDVVVTTNVGGALLFTGKRLWGVDFAADGTELVIDCQRSGSGTSSVSGAPGSEVYVLEMSSYWGIFINDVELLRASYNTPQITYTNGSPATTIQTGGGVISVEYLAVHALDARTEAAVIERLTMEMAGTAVICTGAQASALNLGSHAFDPFVRTLKLQVIFEGVVAAEYSETEDAGIAIPIHAEMGVQNNLLNFYRYGQPWRPQDKSTVVGATTHLKVPSYPQVGSWNAENIYEWIYQADPGATGRDAHLLFDAYPNQLTDALMRMYWQYGKIISSWDFELDWDDSRLGTFNGANVSDIDATAAFLQLGSPAFLIQGLAVPREEPLHFVASTAETYVHNFYNVMTKLSQKNAGSAQTGIDPVYRASVFTRDTTSDPFDETDILTTISAAVTADGNTVDAATFQINPVRVL